LPVVDQVVPVTDIVAIQIGTQFLKLSGSIDWDQFNCAPLFRQTKARETCNANHAVAAVTLYLREHSVDL
jgi:hypothetical protein